MNLYEIQIREVGDRQPLTTYNALAGDLEDAQQIVKEAASEQYSTISIQICSAREIARDVIFDVHRMRPTSKARARKTSTAKRTRRT